MIRYSFPYFLLFIFSLSSCSSDIEDSSIEKENNLALSKSSQNSNYTYKVVKENKVLEVTAIKSGNEIKNIFYFFDSETHQDYFTLEYLINPSEEGWKYSEQEKVISFANELKDLYSKKEDLEELNFILDNTITNLYIDIETNGIDAQIFSPIYQLKSAVSANLRAINKDSNRLEGIISPTFLTGNTNFLFQEDIVYDTANLKTNLEEIKEIESITPGDDDLISLIESTSKEKITFDELYELYIPKEEFLNHIADNVAFHHSDCDIANCSIGCGTDWGCCGSYTGCCYISARLCYIHDRQCSDCSPSWYCLPGCEPDGGVNDTVKYFSLQ
jgi:uncharacterized protein (UPF0335 family)